MEDNYLTCVYTINSFSPENTMFMCKLLAIALLFNLHMIFQTVVAVFYGGVVTRCLDVGVKIYPMKYNQSLHNGEHLQLLVTGGS